MKNQTIKVKEHRQWSTVLPYVLRETCQIPEGSDPSNASYCPDQQLWICNDTHRPWVSLAIDQPGASDYGETPITETREGVDQSEGSNHLYGSDYGETIQTKTHEGVDQTEASERLADY